MYLSVSIGLGWITLIVLIYSFVNTENQRIIRSIGMSLLSLASLSLVPYMLNESQRFLQSVGLILLSLLLVYISIGVIKDKFRIEYTARLVTVTMTVFLAVYTIDSVQKYLITMTAKDTIFLLSITGFEAEIMQNGSGTFISFPSTEEPLMTQIITACTGVGTMSVFIGLITSFRQLSARQKIALSFSVASLIYALNAMRNFFISASYGYQMLHIAPDIIKLVFGRGDEWVSYYIADRIISQIGSLIFISYLGFVLMDRYDSSLIDEWKTIFGDLKTKLDNSRVKDALRAYRQ